MAMLTLNDQIIEFVAEQTGIKRERLSLEKTLFGDLGVDGQDGVGAYRRVRQTV